MKKEIYLLMVIIMAVVSVALYIRYFYQPTMSLVLTANNTATAQFYPYQRVTVNVNVFNNGSVAISNMSIGIFVNGNLSSLYKVTLPTGKQTSISYNYSPTLAGSYTVSAVADPGKLYNLENRPQAQTSTTFSVLAAQGASPEEMLPKRNVTGVQGENLTRGGYLLSAYLSTQYNISNFALTRKVNLNKFLTPVLNLTSYYIRNISVASAAYANSSSAYSIWIKGYLAPNIFSVAAAAAGLNWSNFSARGGMISGVSTGVKVISSKTATLVRLDNKTTFCSWYSGGWLKTLSYSGTGTCIDLLNATISNASVEGMGIGSALYGKIAIRNSSPLANYSGASGNSAYAAKTYFLNNASFVYAGIFNNTSQSSTCYGIISFMNGTYYCNTYLLPSSGAVQSLSLIRTTAYVGSYNLTVLSLVNTSLAITQVPVALDIIKDFNISGSSLALKSGIVNTCAFNDSFACDNLTYFNGTVSFRLTNMLNSTVKLNSAECYTIGSVVPLPMNVTLGSMKSTNVSTACFGLSGKLSGFVLGQHLRLALNYSNANTTQKALGSAFIPFG